MKRIRAASLAYLLAFCAFGFAAGSEALAAVPPPEVAKASIDDFAWLAGRWQGDGDNIHLEEICSGPARRLMMCMVRFTDAEKTTGMELATLEEKVDGMEERIRFFAPGLEERAGAKALLLRLTKLSQTESVFENTETSGPRPKRVTLTRNGPDDFHVHIEVEDQKGQTAFIDAHWKRSK
jgi:Domain of unknown function (DUF6265)